jgi:hypothetical protein
MSGNSAVRVGWQTLGSAPDENRFTVPRNKPIGHMVVFEAKKIPDELLFALAWV